MSRGPRSRQRAILEALERNGDRLTPLGGDTRSGRVALVRAARALERAGLCDVVQLWNDDGTAVRLFVCKPGSTEPDGTPTRNLSVARVTYGTGATLTGSIRHIAREHNVSSTQVWRDLKLARAQGL